MDTVQAIIVGITASLAVLVFVFLIVRKRRNPLRDGRQLWFEYGMLHPDAPNIAGVLGLLMDMNVGGNRSSVIVMADGATSLYWPSGAVIGAGNHEPVRAKASVFLDNAVRCLALFGTSPNRDQPAAGRVRLFVWTTSGIKFVESSGEIRTDDSSPIARLFLSGNEVISAVADHLEARAAMA